MSLSEIFFQLEKKDKETIKIAYLVIDYCNKHNIEITNLKLIKFLYFINIEYMLKNNGIPIFEEEFLAWRHGPVLQSVYDYFCLGMVKASNEKINLINNELDDSKKDCIKSVLDKKAYCEAWTLVDETHIKNGPWEKIYNKYKNHDGICKHVIPNKLIYEFYSKQTR